VRVRLTPEEHAAWSTARAGAGRRDLGAWVRITGRRNVPSDPRFRDSFRADGSVLRNKVLDVSRNDGTNLTRNGRGDRRTGPNAPHRGN